MASSAVQGFTDPYASAYDGYAADNGYSGSSYYGDSGLPGMYMSFMGMDMSALRDYDKVLDNRAYERASIDSARAWSEYMDNTAVQRRVKDIEAAGLNPWLAVQSGISGSGAPSVDKGGSAQHQTSSGQSKGALGQLFGAIAKLL